MSTEVTELTGKVVDGNIVLDQPGQLKEGTEVRVRPISRASTHPNENGSLSDMLLRFAGTVDGLPEDMARNHDHYLYGVPKKTE